MNIVCIVFDTLRRDCLYGQPEWGPVHTPHLDSFARQSVVFERAYPESLPTLPARRGLYTGCRVYPFDHGDFRLKGDFVGAPGWGPIPEDQDTISELVQRAGYRTALISDLYHQFKPSKNFWRGFDEWEFIRGQEVDPMASGPKASEAEIAALLAPETPNRDHFKSFIGQVIMNNRHLRHEQDYQAPRVLSEAARWVERNHDADKFYLQVESFDPHEPWIAPSHYVDMYGSTTGAEWVISTYSDVSSVPAALIARARANYSASVTMCDRWFGHFMETLRVTGRLDDTLVIVLSDHGHSIGDRSYLGKRGYPSAPEVFDIPLFVRYPGAANAGTVVTDIVSHLDVSATILEAAGVDAKIDGRSFWTSAPAGAGVGRKHFTIGWGTTPTVVTDDWWFNGKVDGTGFLLYDLRGPGDPFATNVADANPRVAKELFDLAVADAGPGGFPDWLLDVAHNQADAPGCTPVAERD